MANQEMFDRYRPLLFSMTYKMMGSVAESEEVLAETRDRWLAVDFDLVEQPRLYLLKAITNRSMIRLRDAEATRNLYPGTWLPEPLMASVVEQEGQQGWEWHIGFLRLLDLLGIQDRAIYLLRGSMDLSYEEISMVIGKPQSFCRQQWEHAREIMTAGGSQQVFDANRQKHLKEAVQHAVTTGQFARLIECMDIDVVQYTDAGGDAFEIPPVIGREKVWKSLQRVFGPANPAFEVRFASVNDCPALILHDRVSDRPESVMIFEAIGRMIDAIYVIRSAEKLDHVRLMHV